MPGFTTHYILGMKAYNDLPAGQLKYIIAKYCGKRNLKK